MPSDINPSSPGGLFKLFFEKDIVQSICDNSNEYAESLNDVKPVMYGYFLRMTADDLYKLLSILLHLGYRKIPR